MTLSGNQKAFEDNLQAEIRTTLTMAESPGRKLLIIAVWSDDDPSGGSMATGGIVRTLSDGVLKRDGVAFIVGLKREISRISTNFGVDSDKINLEF